MPEDNNKQNLTIFVISDSAGETASKLAQATMAQYPTVEFVLFRRTFITTDESLLKALKDAEKHNAIILHTLINKHLVEITHQFCDKHQLYQFDVLTPPVLEVEKRSGIAPSNEPGAMHHLDKNYFRRIKSMEFAVKYDDGKDPRGFLEADVVLLGVSRTSKTPLSLFLANKNLKVANLPIVPQAHIPKQIWEVDPNKIVGLTNDPEVLNTIRKERMIAYGLNPDSAYSDIDKIKEELNFAKDLYEKLGCITINVASLSIEETASVILNELDLEDHSYYGSEEEIDEV
ncbi:putative pyruvate, phosphate dikinase regulatory protein [Tetragenococcus halophilus subsp. halophilus]|uniref:Putative pyruvate, phosphate dikinase regulatory protein n=3 Tax=Tetragenococcus halophilus TaxID=51669 RepID=A0A2H6CUF8_TETHA|nr:pyruvate, water dikinase regulatory protein [Tetragenococcus halophilus]AOF49088.1 phosphotransferase [Tetragenococcus halophilus]AYW50692.1 kinase/pyrophosphorylase [Tetragenococcus halophilus]MCF1675128.1 kinase/pyrophosphorylase [Tetragenococcus halophilus]MCO7025685.1 kinase/pyrophosphorylase [Tetragenococcus halophilus]MCO8283634.1 kinase/pyrophosphorylase [Tetragenococcus halophilus]